MSDSGSYLSAISQIAGAAGSMGKAGGGPSAGPTGGSMPGVLGGPRGGSSALAPIMGQLVPSPTAGNNPVLPPLPMMELTNPGGNAPRGPMPFPSAGGGAPGQDTSGAQALGSIMSLIGIIAAMAA